MQKKQYKMYWISMQSVATFICLLQFGAFICLLQFGAYSHDEVG